MRLSLILALAVAPPCVAAPAPFPRPEQRCEVALDAADAERARLVARYLGSREVWGSLPAGTASSGLTASAKAEESPARARAVGPGALAALKAAAVALTGRREKRNELIQDRLERKIRILRDELARLRERADGEWLAHRHEARIGRLEVEWNPLHLHSGPRAGPRYR